MAFLLGIDTGGTFTDAVILETDDAGTGGQLIAKAKALTTRHDLAIGIAEALAKVMQDSGCDPASIGLVSLSTTLATNALVEGQGGTVALISIGFEERDLKNAGLADALGNDPVIRLTGGHSTHGAEAQPLDMKPLKEKLGALSEAVSGFAVAGYFAVRNPEHELAVRDLILEKTGKAVTCSHELSARLNGPKRALTTVLNARLIPMITRLIRATRTTLEEYKITAPVMVVRGDGALVSADFAIKRPIETILSGPAASLVGARFLTGADRAFVNDIGGTTSDVAVLEDGKPQLDLDGAIVGNYQTMVEAVAMHTFGLGGDSEVAIEGPTHSPKIRLGPKRLVPICLIANTHPEIIHKALEGQLKSILNNRHDGRFVFLSNSEKSSSLSVAETKLLSSITDTPQAVEGLLEGASQGAALNTLVSRGLVLVAGLTPSDAMHALGRHNFWDTEAAFMALRLFSRKRDGGGKPLFEEPIQLAEKIVESVQRRSAEVVLETAFHIDGKDGHGLVQHPIVGEILNGRQNKDATGAKVKLSLALDRPLIGLGASAHAYHPGAAKLLGTTAIVPKDADVANAIGAVVGQISVRTQVTITQPTEGRFQLTGNDKPFLNEDVAQKAAKRMVRENVIQLAAQAGAGEIEISIDRKDKRAKIESRDTLVESTITATATGRPPIVSS